GALALPERDKLLAGMTDEVAALVLRDNYFQTQSLSVSGTLAPALLDAQERFIKTLEKAGRLNRALEFLPSDEELAERRAAKLGLTSPERAVLLAYAKIALNDELVGSNVPDDPWVATALERYFPTPLGSRYKAQIHAHPLRREIIATHVTNSMVNRVGSTFVHRMQEETGAAAPDVVRAYLIVREVFGFVELWRASEALDYQVPDRTQTAMIIDGLRLIVRATLWFLRHRERLGDLAGSIEHFRIGSEHLAGELDFPWLRERIGILPAENHWQTLAKAALRDDLSGMLRALTADALGAGDVATWKARNAVVHERLRQILAELRAVESPDLAMLSVAMRELRNLASR